MILSSAPLSWPDLENDDISQELDDPFAALIGQGEGSDALWLGRAVPRYSSYPPSCAFEDSFAPSDYRNILESLSPEEPVSLYLHLPFCQSLCLYCNCGTCVTQGRDKLEDYLTSLHREIETIALSCSRPRRVGHVFFGGGTPNLLSEKDIGLMMGALARRFDLGGVREISMELDPRLVTKAQARMLGMAGITHVSLGVQDFNPDVQKAIGRIQPFGQVADACRLLREAGVAHLSFDLMYGLPCQSPSSLADTARLAVTLNPDRIALYPYAHSPQIRPHQKALESFILPGPHAALALEAAARTAFREAGYVEIGMDHFAKPADSLAKALTAGTLRRCLQGYTDDDSRTLLGIGAGSIGHTPDYFIRNASGIDDYRARIARFGLAVADGVRLSGEDKLRGAIIGALMTEMSVNLEAAARAHNFSLSSLLGALDALEPFEKAGIVRRQGMRVSLSSPHRMAIRVIASLFDNTGKCSKNDALDSRAA